MVDKLWKFIALIIFEAGVFFLGSWLVVRFLAANEAIHNAIGILFIFAVGITVILYGNATGNRNLNVLGFAVFLFAIYFVIDRYEGFAVKISAFATLAVAIAAFAAIEENRRIRRDSVERESRDRKERWIDEVGVWLRELGERTLPKAGEFFWEEEDMLIKTPEIDRGALLLARAADLAKAEWDALDDGIRKAEYYQKLTSQLNEELSSLIKVVVTKLMQRKQLHIEAARNKVAYVETLKASKLLRDLIEEDKKALEGLNLSKQDVIVVEFGRNVGAIRKSIRNALEKAIEVKVSLIQVS